MDAEDPVKYDYSLCRLGILGTCPRKREQRKCDGCPLVAGCDWRRVGSADPFQAGPRQSTFEGSDRQGRGRLVDALRRGPVAIARAAHIAGWPGDSRRAQRVVDQLVADGLARVDGSELTLT